MTREDARYYLQSSGFSEEQIATIEQAFKQEPSSDLIRRTDLLDMVENMTDQFGIKHRVITEGMISLLPSVNSQSCEDAISRQAVMDCFKKWQPYMATRLHEFEKELSELPSVAIPPDHDGCKDCRWQSQSEIEMPCKQCMHNYTDEWERAKIGHWIWQTEDIYQCSECGEDIHVKEVMNEPQYAWCPICGCPMEIER